MQVETDSAFGRVSACSSGRKPVPPVGEPILRNLCSRTVPVIGNCNKLDCGPFPSVFDHRITGMRRPILDDVILRVIM